MKARQAAIEEENKRRREEERAKREATRKAAEEEKARKEEEKRKRMQEEREREAARELKRKEREERLRAERREKEEKERKVKEEKEARLAKEREEKEREKKEREEREEREEKERVEKEKKALKEKEEREAKEKLVAQQRVVTVAAAGPSSAKQVVRNVPPATSPVKPNSSGLVASGSSPAGLQRSPNTSVNSAINNNLPILAKKGSYSNNKPPAISASISSPNILVNPNRAPAPPHLTQISQPGGSSSRGPPGISQPPTPHTPQLPHSSHAPSTPGMMFGSQGQPGGMMPSPQALSPRLANYGHGALGSGHVPFGFSATASGGGGPPTPQHPSHLGVHSHQPQPQQLQPSALPRGTFTNGPTSFDPTFQRVSGGGFAPGAGLPSPIGPPSKPKTPMTGGSSGSPTIPGVPSLAPGSGRRSVHDLPGGSNAAGVGAAPGPISRPIAPIARPTGLMGTDNSSPGSNSPVRRSPSPKGVVLGSSALASVDDEVVPVAARRSITTTPFGVSSIGGVGIGVSGVGVIGQPHWGSSSPRGDALARSGPWGSTSGFSAAPGSRPGVVASIGAPGMMNHNHNHNHHNNTLHPISGGHHHPQHPAGGPPGVPPGNVGTFSLWGAPAPGAGGPSSGATVDWHTGPPPGPPGIIGTPFYNNAAPFMGHNHNATPGSPVTHSGAGAGGGGGA